MNSEPTSQAFLRLTGAEKSAIDRAAKSQPIPVSRSAMLASIVREWIKQNEKETNASKMDQ
jgi:hypothetical protein